MASIKTVLAAVELTVKVAPEEMFNLLSNKIISI